MTGIENYPGIYMRLTPLTTKKKTVKMAAASNNTHQASGFSIEDNRNVSTTLQPKTKGVLQAVWYDDKGVKQKGNPPKGWIKVNDNVIGIHWIPPQVDLDEYSDSSSVVEDENNSDSEYVEKVSKSKNKKKDKGSEIKSSTYKRKNEDIEYETESGIKHKETYDSKNKKRVTESTGLKFNSEFRNPAHRDKNMFKVYNHYDLSVGQQGQNQMVVSHNTPSWSGMQAGKDFGNFSLTSPHYNSEIEQKEKELRSGVENSKNEFSYKTETEYEDILSEDAPEIEKAIAKLYKKSKWKKERIKKRLKKVKEKYPTASRIKKEKRTLKKGGKSNYFSKERDLLAYIPRRAYNEEAHQKYIDARGQDSEESDLELEEKLPSKPKKKKK